MAEVKEIFRSKVIQFSRQNSGEMLVLCADGSMWKGIPQRFQATLEGGVYQWGSNYEWKEI